MKTNGEYTVRDRTTDEMPQITPVAPGDDDVQILEQEGSVDNEDGSTLVWRICGGDDVPSVHDDQSHGGGPPGGGGGGQRRPANKAPGKASPAKPESEDEYEDAVEGNSGPAPMDVDNGETAGQQGLASIPEGSEVVMEDADDDAPEVSHDVAEQEMLDIFGAESDAEENEDDIDLEEFSEWETIEQRVSVIPPKAEAKSSSVENPKATSDLGTAPPTGVRRGPMTRVTMARRRNPRSVSPPMRSDSEDDPVVVGEPMVKVFAKEVKAAGKNSTI